MSKDILKVVRNLMEKIEQEVERLNRLKTLAGNITARLDGMPHENNNSSRVENLTAAIIDSENRINLLEKVRMDCTIELSAWLDGQIEDNRQSQVMFLRYGLCKSFESIAGILNYSCRTVFRLHRSGLLALGIKPTLSDVV